MIWNEDNEVEPLLAGMGIGGGGISLPPTRLMTYQNRKTAKLASKVIIIYRQSAIGTVLVTPLHTVSNHSKNIIKKRINCYS
jgi:hypothetical protein